MPGVTDAGLGRAALRLYRPLAQAWCGGCALRDTQSSIARALVRITAERQGLTNYDPRLIEATRDSAAMVSGIGCTGRTSGYFGLFQTVHVTHGRAIPAAIGLKSAQPDKIVIAIGGDGDMFSIGGNHFLHAARGNAPVVVICYDNGIYGMTGGQGSPTTPQGEFSVSTPRGVVQKPLDPIKLALGLDTAFVAQGTVTNDDSHRTQLEELIYEAIKHNLAGNFAFVNVVGTCHTERGSRNEFGTPYASREHIAQMLAEGRYPLGIIRRENLATAQGAAHYQAALDEAALVQAESGALLEEMTLGAEDRLALMPKTAIRFAGVAGWGIIGLGEVLMAAAVRAGMQSVVIKNYEAEQRGGDTDVDLVVSQGRIHSPVVTLLDVLVALNPTTFNKFTGQGEEGRGLSDVVSPNGKILVNSSDVRETFGDRRVVASPMRELLTGKVHSQLETAPPNNYRGINTLAAAIAAGYLEVVPREAVEAAVMTSEAGHKAPKLNRLALRVGFEEADRLKALG